MNSQVVNFTNEELKVLLRLDDVSGIIAIKEGYKVIFFYEVGGRDSWSVTLSVSQINYVLSKLKSLEGNKTIWLISKYVSENDFNNATIELLISNYLHDILNSFRNINNKILNNPTHGELEAIKSIVKFIEYIDILFCYFENVLSMDSKTFNAIDVMISHEEIEIFALWLKNYKRK